MHASRTVLAASTGAVAARNTTSRACCACLTQLPLHQRRAFSRSTTRYAAPASPAPTGLAELTSRKLISISGPDAAKYLQGVITANLASPGYAGPNPTSEHIRTDVGFYAAFLTAQGRILHDVFIYRDLRDTSHPPGHSWLVEVDAAEAERLQKHIKRYKLRAKFNVRMLDDGESRVWHAWDDNVNSSSSSSPLISASSTTAQTKIITTPDTRAPNLGHRILTFSSSSSSSSSSNPPPELTATTPITTTVLPEDAYTLRRYLHGVAEGQAELIYGQALPHEGNLDLTGAVDFRKGCYVGQELTIRTEHRGVVRKRILPCVLYPEEGGSAAPAGLTYRPEIASGLTADMVASEASIGRVGRKGRSAGKWLRGVGNVGLALCRLETMTDVVLPGESSAGGPGYAEGDEFSVALGPGDNTEGGAGEAEQRKVRIKAFVPEWLRNGLAAKGQQH
ncbi:hypothetical protein P885DRAFT_26790 [Corynascus similis CBS 632.67]